MAILINTVGSDKFSLNGKTFSRIFQPLAAGLTHVAIYNTYDTRLQILSPTHYSEFKVNNTTYGSQSTLIAGLLNVVFVPASGGGGGSGASWGSITGTLVNQGDLQSALNAKQAKLTSGSNIKTINGQSLLGSGNITITSGGGTGSSAWADITGKPSTLSGYGITDAEPKISTKNSAFNKSFGSSAGQVAEGNHNHTGVYEPVITTKGSAFNVNFGTGSGQVAMGNHTHSFSQITSKPSTISGYGITDFNSLGDARWSLSSHTHTFAQLTSKPTNIAGYGISDAYTKSQADGKYLLNTSDTLTGNLAVTGTITTPSDVISEDPDYRFNNNTAIGARFGKDSTAAYLDYRRWLGSGTNSDNALITQTQVGGKYGLNFLVSRETTFVKAGTSRMFIANEGNIGIGTTTPSEKLEVNGNVKATLFLESSDTRLKTNVNPISKSFISYEMKEDLGTTRYGVLAQDLEVNNPELVSTDSEGYKSVNYTGLLVMKLADAENRIERLEALVEQLLKDKK